MSPEEQRFKAAADEIIRDACSDIVKHVMSTPTVQEMLTELLLHAGLKEDEFDVSDVEEKYVRSLGSNT